MQGYCVRCRGKKGMRDAGVMKMKNGKSATWRVCPACGTRMSRMGKR